jgi:hypothetical protein
MPGLQTGTPSPDVHERVRAFLERGAHSSYLPVEPV